MNKRFKHKILTGAALFGALFMGVSCNDEWDDHYSNSGVNSQETLWNIIKSDKDLTNFCEVVDACQCADSLFGQSRTYTLWAPVNDYVNKDSLLQEITDGNRDVVLKQFVFAHIAEYLHPANGTLDGSNILLLNKKKAPFEGTDGAYTFDGLTLIQGEYNIRLHNGLLHKLSGKVYYAPSIWEYIRSEKCFDSIADFLYSFNKETFDPYSSIVGPTENGETTYIDSVFNTSNMFFELGGNDATAGFGDISSEDSSFVMYVPTNELWDKLVRQTEKLYNFDRTADVTDFRRLQMDTLQHRYARKAICNYLVFSDYENKREDSILSTFRPTRVLFSKEDLDNAVESEMVCSNGVVKKLKEFPFPSTLWHDTIKIEAENMTYIMDLDSNQVSSVTTPGYSVTEQRKDSVDGLISGNAYLNLHVNDGITSYSPRVRFRIPNVLSGSYNVGFVVVPSGIGKSTLTASDSLPVRIRATLTCGDGKSTKKLYDISANKQLGLINDPLRVDTLFLLNPDSYEANGYREAEQTPVKFTFDHSEYNYDIEDEATVELELRFDAGRRATQDVGYSRSLRLDYIVFIPVADDESEGDVVVDESSTAGK